MVRIDETYISEGKYPQLLSKGINRPECGAGIVPDICVITYSTSCFKNNYSDTIWYYFPKDPYKTVSTRIYSGSDAGYDEAPFAVYIKYIRDMSGVCSGALIALDWVVTAAHCYNQLW